MILITFLITILGSITRADPVRVATFNVSLNRKGPGILLQDLVSGTDAQIQNVVAIIQTTRPDILLLNELDHDFKNRALRVFLDVLATETDGRAGIHYPYFYAPPQNTGVPSGYDLNGDGRLGGPADAFGFGHFRGQYAMALVSRFPIDMAQARDFSSILWKDIPRTQRPRPLKEAAFPSPEILDQMRLSSKGHWDVPVHLPSGKMLHILASHPTPPVFDGPEDMNGFRNRAEILFWERYIRDAFQDQNTPFVLLGDLNLDPQDGEGHHDAITKLLSAEYLQDPMPKSNGGLWANAQQGGANLTHKGDPALDTADWRDTPGPGNLRVDYVLPSKNLHVTQAQVYWPIPSKQGFDWIGADGRASSDHRLVWVDLK